MLEDVSTTQFNISIIKGKVSIPQKFNMLGFQLLAIILFGAAVNVDADNIKIPANKATDTDDNLPQPLTLRRYFQNIGGWLELYHLPATWHNARLGCQLKGGALASPANATLRDAMAAVLGAPGAADRVRTFGGAFTGVHATITKGYFFSIEGVPLEDMPLRWWGSDPDNRRNNEDCLVMTTTGEMADVECNSTRPYLCFKKGSENEELDACGEKNSGYQLHAGTGKCYKFHELAHNWARAFKTCAAERAHLALVRTSAEAAAVREIHEHATTATCAFVGFRDWSGEGDWQTVKGEPMKSLEIWSSLKWSQSPFGGCGQFCHNPARYSNSGTNWFSTVNCNLINGFVCEKIPRSK